MTRPMDRTCSLPQVGQVNEAAGEFWVENPFMMPHNGQNLSAYERNRLFMNLGDRKFIDVSRYTSTDLDSDSRSVVVADFNRDGRTDLLVGSVGGGPLRLFLNEMESDNRSVRVTLQGTTSNRQGIGAKIRLKGNGINIQRSVYSPNGCMGQSPAETLIGIEKSQQPEQIEICWPSGVVQEVPFVNDAGIRVEEPFFGK